MNKREIHSVVLKHWLTRFKAFFRYFRSLTFHHIYKEFNELASDLSKRAIGLGTGFIRWEEYSGNLMTDSGSLQLY